MRFYFPLIYFCFTLSFINVSAADIDNFSMSNNESDFSDYITVTFDQIYLTNDGMFIHVNKEFVPIYALYFDGVDQYKCEIHNRLKDLITCPDCGRVYDGCQYKACPNTTCPSRRSGPKY